MSASPTPLTPLVVQEKYNYGNMPPPLFTEAQELRIKQLMHASLNEFFASKGKNAKSILFTLAAIVGALTVIFGGMKTVLAWLGFHYIIPKL